MTFLLHTWTRDLRYHAHLHGLGSAGGLAMSLDPGERMRAPGNGSHRVPTSEKFLFHVHRIGALFKGKFMDLLREAQGRGELGLTEVAFNVLMAKLWKQKWVVYAKRPTGKPGTPWPIMWRPELCGAGRGKLHPQ